MTRAKKLLCNRDTQRTELLMTPVQDLGLKIRGSLLETCVEKAMAEIKAFGVTLEPHFYLSDAYGCMEGSLSIGLAFWDADDTLREMVRETKDIFRSEGELLRTIKHEIGHAFCYAYKLYRLKEFRETFNVEGHFFRSYPDDNRFLPDPFSPDYVNPEGDHYAQKHPDDDFAETFATFIDPAGGWKDLYKGQKGALRKIYFARRAIRGYGGRPPFINGNGKPPHVPVEEIRQTVAEFFGISPRRYAFNADGYMDADLKAIFRTPGRIQKPTLPSWQLLNRYRLFIERSVAVQSRLTDGRVARDVMDKIASRLKALRLIYLEEEEGRTLARLTSFVLLKVVCFKLFNTFRLPVR